MTSPSKPLLLDPQLDVDPAPTLCRNRAFSQPETGRLLLPGLLRGVFSMLLYGINTLFWCVFLFLVAILKAVLPGRWVRRRCNHILNAIANAWIKGNILNQKITANTCWDVRGVENLKPDA